MGENSKRRKIGVMKRKTEAERERKRERPYYRPSHCIWANEHSFKKIRKRMKKKKK